MSFEDDQYVEFDYGEDMFYITSNSGEVRGYAISDEPDLVNHILDSKDRGEIDVYLLSTEQDKEFELWSQDIKEEYREKFGEDFEDWSW